MCFNRSSPRAEIVLHRLFNQQTFIGGWSAGNEVNDQVFIYFYNHSLEATCGYSGLEMQLVLMEMGCQCKTKATSPRLSVKRM